MTAELQTKTAEEHDQLMVAAQAEFKEMFGAFSSQSTLQEKRQMVEIAEGTLKALTAKIGASHHRVGYGAMFLIMESMLNTYLKEANQDGG